MLTHRGFSAWIVSNTDSKPIPEYLIAEDTTQHRVSCWIPSEEGQGFTVWWRDHGGKIDTCAYISLDGFVVPGRFLFGHGVASRQGVRVGANEERPFTFKKIDDGGPEYIPAKDAGTIVLRIKRVERVGSRAPNPLFTNIPPSSTSTKSGDMCITFGNASQTFHQYTSTWDVKPHVSDRPELKKPSTYVTFVFRYRSRDFLQSQGIMMDVKLPAQKRTPSKPQPTSSVPSPNNPLTPQLMARDTIGSDSIVHSLTTTPSSSPGPIARPRSRVVSPSNYALGRGIPSSRQRVSSSEMRRTASWRAFSNKFQDGSSPHQDDLERELFPNLMMSSDENLLSLGDGL